VEIRKLRSVSLTVISRTVTTSHGFFTAGAAAVGACVLGGVARALIG
jgi:hypothetical protein